MIKKIKKLICKHNWHCYEQKTIRTDIKYVVDYLSNRGYITTIRFLECKKCKKKGISKYETFINGVGKSTKTIHSGVEE